MLRKLSLSNWKSHEETTVEFAKGTNILVGIMGSGKSSVLDAISFALFGTFPAVLHRRMKIADAVMSRPVEKKEAVVELEFESGGAAYSVKRTVFRKGGADAELRRSGVLVMSDAEKVTEEVVRLLGIDYSLFCRAVYAEQNRMDYFLSLPPSERKKQVDELLWIDRFEAARANAGTVVNSLGRMKDEGERELLGVDLKALEEKAGAARKEIGEISAARDGISRGLQDADLAVRGAESGYSSLEKVRREWDSLRQRKAGLEHTAKELRSELAKRKDAGVDAAGLAGEASALETGEKEAKAGAKSASGRISELRREEGELKGALSELERKLKQRNEIAKALAGIDGGVEGAVKRTTESKAKRAGLEKALAAAEAELKALRSSVGELEEGHGDCPVCDRGLDERMRGELLKMKRGKLDALSRETAKQRGELSRLEMEGVRLERELSEAALASKRLAEFEGIEKRIDDSRAAASRIVAKVAEEERERLAFEKRLEECGGKLRVVRDRISAVKEVASLKARELAAGHELREVEAKLSSMKFDEKAFEGARDMLEELRGKMAGLKAEARVLEERAKAVKERAEAAEKEIRMRAEKAARVAKLGSLAEGMGIFQDSLVQTQAALREEMIEAINAKMDELWPSVYPYGDYKEIALKAGENDYSLELKVGDAWVPVEGFASGGERACASLALRVALAFVIVPDLKWIVLDEPTHNLDEQGIRALIDVLHERMPEIVEQVFVITHDESLKEAASGRLYRFERDKEIGEPTRVIELN